MKNRHFFDVTYGAGKKFLNEIDDSIILFEISRTIFEISITFFPIFYYLYNGHKGTFRPNGNLKLNVDGRGEKRLAELSHQDSQPVEQFRGNIGEGHI